MPRSSAAKWRSVGTTISGANGSEAKGLPSSEAKGPLRARPEPAEGADSRLGYAPYRARVIWPRLMPRDEAQEVLNESLLVGNGLRSVRTAMDQIYSQYYAAYSIAPRACHPRDIIDHLLDISKYLEVESTLSVDLVHLACHSYFLDFPTTA